MASFLYFDNNATTRPHPRVLVAMRAFQQDNYANPASPFAQYSGLAQQVTEGKGRILNRLGARDGNTLLVTAGATEANNLALQGAARANPVRRHIIVSSIEHPSVLEVVRHLESNGYQLSLIPVSKSGVVDREALAGLLRPDTLLVSVMLANNETGVIQPMAKIAAQVKAFDPSILVHTDATQAVGKLILDFDADLPDVDMLSFSGHKFHGPKGAGGLLVRDLHALAPISFGGGHQEGMRPGTEDPSDVAGLAEALDLAHQRQGEWVRVEGLRAEVEATLRSIVPGAGVLGAAATRLPNTCAMLLPGITATDLVDHLAAKGVAISTGSACSHGAERPSHVALAMGLSHEAAGQCIRISLSVETTAAEVKELQRALASAVTSLLNLADQSYSA